MALGGFMCFAAVALMLVGSGLAMAALDNTGLPVPPVPVLAVGLFIAGLIVIVLGRRMAHHTADGARSSPSRSGSASTWRPPRPTRSSGRGRADLLPVPALCHRLRHRRGERTPSGGRRAAAAAGHVMSAELVHRHRLLRQHGLVDGQLLHRRRRDLRLNARLLGSSGFGVAASVAVAASRRGRREAGGSGSGLRCCPAASGVGRWGGAPVSFPGAAGGVTGVGRQGGGTSEFPGAARRRRCLSAPDTTAPRACVASGRC